VDYSVVTANRPSGRFCLAHTNPLGYHLPVPRPREKIYPFFLGMVGCPGECIYCDQKRTADPGEVLTPAEVTAALDRDLDDVGPWTVAFYGGTFTGLPLDTIGAYLDAVWSSRYADAIGGVRVSTRPDTVDGDVLAALTAGCVKTVELGVQSFDDRVLRNSRRGYTAGEAADACAAVKNPGFILGVQLMVGLPGEDERAWRKSVEKTAEVRPEFVRLYPTLIVKSTELADEYAGAKYAPLDLDEAVERCAEACERFLGAGIRVERVGLQEITGLGNQVVAGPYHPAFGGLVWTEVMRRRLERILEDRTGAVTVRANSRTASAVIGHGRRNAKYFREGSGVTLSVELDITLPDYEVVVEAPD
jgi:histone acetyltransferase (RNA polymerase elongator complex component)